MSNSQWSLSYWIRGMSLCKHGRVKVPSDIDVRTLFKHLRGESVSLAQHDILSVAIYKVPDDRQIPLGKSMPGSLGVLSVSMLGEELDMDDQVSEIFQTPPLKFNLHLIVDIPLLSVHCWPRGLQIRTSFAVNCSKHDSVYQLKLAIEQHRPIFSQVDLRLYKIPISCTDDDHIREFLDQSPDGPLLQSQKLNECFGDVPFSQVAHVIVGVNETDRDASKQPPSTYKRVLKPTNVIGEARKNFLAGVKSESPSVVARPQEFGRRQKEKYAVVCGRPRHEQDIIPPPLLHPVFAEFMHDCETIEVETKDNGLIEELAEKMANFVDTEKTRADNFTGAVKAHYEIGLQDDNLKIGSFQMDGGILANGHRSMIMEVKNEGSLEEAHFQTIAYYLESTRGTAPIFTQSCLPCLLVVIAGPTIAFSGAVWNRRPVITKMTSAGFDFHDMEHLKQKRLARHLVAFRKAVGRLEEYYQTLEKPNRFHASSATQAPLQPLNVPEPSNNPPGSGRMLRSMSAASSQSNTKTARQSRTTRESETGRDSEPTPPSDTTPVSEPIPTSNTTAGSEPTPPSNTRSSFDPKTTTLFPYPTSYERIDGGKIRTVEFKYDRHIDEKKLVFFGTELRSKERICIKFCHTYSKDAHECMENLGHAPGLRGFMPLVGEFTMVVQDALIGFQTLAERTQPLSLSVFKSMTETLNKFHLAGYVHGDIRDVNIMVSDTDEKDFRFIDFDWAGLTGEVRYPANVNTVNITRPGKDLDGKVILESDDRFMLNQLDPRSSRDRIFTL